MRRVCRWEIFSADERIERGIDLHRKAVGRHERFYRDLRRKYLKFEKGRWSPLSLRYATERFPKWHVTKREAWNFFSSLSLSLVVDVFSPASSERGKSEGTERKVPFPPIENFRNGVKVDLPERGERETVDGRISLFPVGKRGKKSLSGNAEKMKIVERRGKTLSVRSAGRMKKSEREKGEFAGRVANSFRTIVDYGFPIPPIENFRNGVKMDLPERGERKAVNGRISPFSIGKRLFSSLSDSVETFEKMKIVERREKTLSVRGAERVEKSGRKGRMEREEGFEMYHGKREGKPFPLVHEERETSVGKSYEIEIKKDGNERSFKGRSSALPRSVDIAEEVGKETLFISKKVKRLADEIYPLLMKRWRKELERRGRFDG